MKSRQVVTYRRISDIELQMEVFQPEPRDRLRPGILFIHGGGWGGGNRSQFLRHAEQFALLGYVTATASYRLSRVAPYPAALDDCQSAVRWLRAHAPELGLDPARLGAFGSSAGGHLVACLGARDTRDPNASDWPGVSSRVQCVVDVHGVHDFPGLPPDILAESLTRFLGGDRAACADAWTDASPIRFVDAETAPMLLLHDPGDSTVPYEQSVQFALALARAGRPFEFIPTPGSGHGYVYNPDGEWTRRIWPFAVAWLAQWLNP
jgi:acetyl esterase/lipase